MENLQKALIMGASVFMFVIAISVAMFSYTTVKDVSDSILTSSENNARTAEYFVANTQDVERYATKAEVIMAIYNMADNDYVADKIMVGTLTFEKTEFTTVDGKNNIERRIDSISNGTYSITYKFTDDFGFSSGKTTIVYKLVSI